MSNNDSVDMLQVLCSLIGDIAYNASPERKFFKRVICADGFTVSVQASEGSYCSPRNSVGPWESVECGFPTEKDPVLERYAEDGSAGVDPESGTVQTVYGWVPSQVVMAIIESHGGMVGGELPEMVDDPDYEGN